MGLHLHTIILARARYSFSMDEEASLGFTDRQSWVEDVTQQIKGVGRQSVKASEDSVIKGVRQSKE